LLAHKRNLSLQGRTGLKLLSAANKRLNTAYVMKEQFEQLWEYKTAGWARRFFERWRDALKWQRLKPFQKFVRDHELPQGVTACRGQVSLCPLLHLPSILPPTTPCRPDASSGFSDIGLTVERTDQGCVVSSRTKRLGFRHSLAGSPRQQAESSLRKLIEISIYCGLDVRLRFLPTPPHGDAVTIDYEEPDFPRRGLAPRQYNNITGARAHLPQGIVEAGAGALLDGKGNG
jgi:hypothetical protein